MKSKAAHLEDVQELDMKSSEVKIKISPTTDSAVPSHLFFEHHPLPMWIYDRATLGFLAVNHATEIAYGYTRAEFLTMTLTELHLPQDAAHLRSDLAATSTAWSDSSAWQHLTKQGELLDVEIYCHNLDYQGHPACMVTVVKKTQRPKVESQEQIKAARLQRYTKQLQQLAEVAVRVNVTIAVQDAMQYIVDQSRQIIDANHSIISLTTATTTASTAQNRREAITAVSRSEKYVKWRTYDGLPVGSRLYELVCQQNRPMRLTYSELISHSEWRGFGSEKERHPQTNGWLAVPLLAPDGSNMGLIQLSDKLPNFDGAEFTEADESILVQLAQIAANILHGTQRYSELQAGEERFREMAENMEDVFWIRDVATDQILYVNSAYERVFGGRIDELYADHTAAKHTLHPDDLPAFEAELKRSPHEKQELQFRIYPLGTEKVRWVNLQRFPIFDTHGQLYRVAGIAKDITARVEAIHALEEEKQTVEALYQLSLALVNVDNIPALAASVIQHAVPALTATLGGIGYFKPYEEDRVHFNWIFEGVDEEFAAFLTSPAMGGVGTTILRERKILCSGDIMQEPILQKTALPKWVAEHARAVCSFLLVPVVSHREEVLGAIFFAHPTPNFFTARHEQLAEGIAASCAVAIDKLWHMNETKRYAEQLEERVIERTHQLEVANRELEAFTYSVSHDLHAPLRAINGFSQALAEQYNELLDQLGLHFLHRIRHNTERMAQMVDNLLHLSRVTSAELHRSQVNLSEIVAGILDELCRIAPERSVKIHIEENVEVHGDYQLLTNVMQNLLENAWKFTSKKPESHIEFFSIPAAEAGDEDASKAAKVYCVRDNGAGFDMAHREKLFNVFQRLHSTTEFSGTGVGLAIVQRIVQRHGGNIWAEADVDQGASFYFTLPTP